MTLYQCTGCGGVHRKLEWPAGAEFYSGPCGVGECHGGYQVKVPLRDRILHLLGKPWPSIQTLRSRARYPHDKGYGWNQ